MLPDGAETLRLVMVSVLAKLLAVMLSMVIVSEAALVMRIADCLIEGGLLSDQRRDSSQKPSVELMQLLVCACETVARIAFTATADIAHLLPRMT